MSSRRTFCTLIRAYGTFLIVVAVISILVYNHLIIPRLKPTSLLMPKKQGQIMIQSNTHHVQSKTHFCDIDQNKLSPYCSSRRELVFAGSWDTWKRESPESRHCKEHCNRKRFLVFICSQGHLCGGFTNRQRGMVTVFLLAQLLGRQFAIIHNKDCELTEYVDYNTYDWYGCNSCIDINDKSIAYNFVNDMNFTKQVETFDFESLFTKKVEFVRTNKFWEHELIRRQDAKVALKEFQNKTHYEVYNIVLSMLFKPKDKLKHFVHTFLKQHKHNHKLVCAQLRNVEGFTVEGEPVRIHGPQDVFQFLDYFNRSVRSRIFIASDSSALKTIAKERYKGHFVTVPGYLRHIDKAKSEEPCKDLFIILADQLILSQCDIQLVINSGVGLYAAYMRPKLENLYCYEHYVSGNIINCTQNDFWRLWLSTAGWKRHGEEYKDYIRSLHLQPWKSEATNSAHIVSP